MGKGSFSCEDIPVKSHKEKFICEKINILDKEFIISAMLMGVPHAVIFVDKLDLDGVHKYQKEIEKMKYFQKEVM